MIQRPIFVHEAWSTLGQSEMLAAFVSEYDALDFAKVRVNRCAEQAHLVITDSRTGLQTHVFRPSAPTAGDVTNGQ